MEKALDSEEAVGLHETGREFIDFDRELFVVLREGAVF
jgi:hypothetical protein